MATSEELFAARKEGFEAALALAVQLTTQAAARYNNLAQIDMQGFAAPTFLQLAKDLSEIPYDATPPQSLEAMLQQKYSQGYDDGLEGSWGGDEL